MQASMQRFLPSPTPEQIADLRLAAAKMTGATRRAFQAERRTGILCLGAQSTCSGRKRWEDEQPQVAQALCQLAETHAQQDPTFRTTLAYTRLTATGALEALRAQGY